MATADGKGSPPPNIDFEMLTISELAYNSHVFSVEPLIGGEVDNLSSERDSNKSAVAVWPAEQAME